MDLPQLKAVDVISWAEIDDVKILSIGARAGNGATAHRLIYAQGGDVTSLGCAYDNQHVFSLDGDFWTLRIDEDEQEIVWWRLDLE
ncbi:MAG: hypothetical protein AAFV53_04700 [Myxococcota bacterium]